MPKDTTPMYRWGEIVKRFDCAEAYGLVLFCKAEYVIVLICFVGNVWLVPNGNVARWALRDVYRSHHAPNTLSLLLENGHVTETLFPVE